MGKKTELEVTSSRVQLPAAPSFMDADERMGIEELSKKIRPPFLKIVQKQSADELHSLFGIGSAILVPDRQLILEAGGGSVRVVFLHFYVEYLKLSGIKFKDAQPMIVERSYDPKSDLARKCQDSKYWIEFHKEHPNDKDYAYRNCEALNFLAYFQEEHLQIETPFVISFSRGSYGKGQQLCTKIKSRKRPIFGSVFDLSIDPTPGRNSSGEWKRFLVENPPENPWVVNEDEYELYKSLHLEAKERIESGTLETGYDDDSLEGTPLAAATGEY